MLALLAKDLRNQRWLLAFWGLYGHFFYLPALFQEDWSPKLSFVLVLVPVLAGSSLFIIGSTQQDGPGTELLVASFPVTRRKLADAKFLGMLLAAAYGLGTSLTLGRLEAGHGAEGVLNPGRGTAPPARGSAAFSLDSPGM
jgi:predicted outer membrane lipoprotein